MPRNTALLVGISGVSSSGKTTLARLLRDIFPRTFILHEDDFYKPDNEIPVKDGVADWDCLEAVNIPQFESTLSHIRSHGETPHNFTSKEDKNSVGEVPVDPTVVEDLKWRASRWMFADAPPIAIVDGFLLYSHGMKPVRDLFDVKIFLRADFAAVKARREARSGYVTLEGFWEDPPNYVDNVVWPNHVKDHAFMFKEGDVEGEYDEGVIHDLGIDTIPDDLRTNMTGSLEWAFDLITAALEKYTKR